MQKKFMEIFQEFMVLQIVLLTDNTTCYYSVSTLWPSSSCARGSCGDFQELLWFPLQRSGSNGDLWPMIVLLTPCVPASHLKLAPGGLLCPSNYLRTH